MALDRRSRADVIVACDQCGKASEKEALVIVGVLARPAAICLHEAGGVAQVANNVKGKVTADERRGKGVRNLFPHRQLE